MFHGPAVSPMPFCDDSFLLSCAEAGTLYHEVAARQPIIDYHCHLSPRDIAEDRRFENLHAIWLDGDHYKWRAMRADGVAEALITGTASTPRDKFQAWAATVPHTLRNPLFHWTHLELRRHFSIDDLLDETTAQRIWDEANRQLATGDLTARGILRRMNVEVVGTTDDPADGLEWHEKIARDGFATKVVPTFRPDSAARVHEPHRVQAWARRLSDTAGIGADTFTGLVAALDRRHADFAAVG
jgi:glucuronate isomerase